MIDQPERTINVSLLSAHQVFAIGSIVGAYKILRKIGQGGMGVVYEAEHQLLHQRVALKTLILNEGEKEEITDRFLVEARVTAQLHHEGIVSVQTLELDKVSNVLYFAMEYIAMVPSRRQMLLSSAITDGKLWFEPYHSTPAKQLRPLSLEDLYQYALKRNRRIHPKVIYQILLDVSAALHVAHGFGTGVIHRDIKPANILIRPNGRAVITDFGVAKVMGHRLRKEILHHQQQSLSLRMNADGSSYHMILGTIEYLAPELREGGTPSPQSDLYALGVLAYQLLVGEMATGTLSPPSASGVSKVWDPLILKCLAPDPKARWKDVAAFREALLGLPKHKRRLLWWRHVGRFCFWGFLFVLGAVGQFLLNPLSTHESREEERIPSASSAYSMREQGVVRPVERPPIVQMSEKTTLQVVQEEHDIPERWVEHGLIYECTDGQTVTLIGMEPNVSLPEVLRIPAFVHGHPVRVLGAKAFESCKTLQRVELPKTLLVIQEQAFLNTTLREIHLPEGLRVIGSQAFKDSKLTEIQLPESLLELGFGAFHNATLRATPKLPSQLRMIAPTVFTGCSFSDGGVLQYPASITMLPQRTLWYTAGLSGLYLPNIQTVSSQSLIYIARDCPELYFPITFDRKDVAFHRDALHTLEPIKVVELRFPKGATPTFDAGFVRNKETAVQLAIAGEAIRHWDWDARQWKDGKHPKALNWATDPNDQALMWQYQTLADGTLALTDLLGKPKAKLQIPQVLGGKTVSAIGNCLLRNHAVEELIVPEGICYLGSLSFARMPTLRRVTLPASICWRPKMKDPVPGHSTDANHLFQHCSQLEEVEMYGVPEVFPYAFFSHCSKLKHVILHDTRIPKVNRYSFEDTPATGVLISSLKDNKCYLFKDNRIEPLMDKTPEVTSTSTEETPIAVDSEVPEEAEETHFKDVTQTLPNTSCKVTYRYQSDGSYALFRTTRLPKKATLTVAATINGLPVRHIASGALTMVRSDTTILLPQVVEFAPNACPRTTPAMVLYPQGEPPIFSRHSFANGLPKFKERGGGKTRKLIAVDNNIAYLRTLTGCLVYAVKPTEATTVTIPERVGDYPIEGILPDAFEGCANVQVLIVEGNSAKRLWVDSFTGCKALYKVSMVCDLPEEEVATYILRSSDVKGCIINNLRK